ncbi:hypothetical protein HW555_012334 [Spodoptera exigua]|uniref:Ionotropic glutamate receptor C-terminal domain-containing protein n=1 Tax=Spodoptera exigua TaxID=7107 RepID=A0A835KZQ5_SPOEX|nr:hypothetical protein HW555_012334 [Spodoptera exigua]
MLRLASCYVTELINKLVVEMSNIGVRTSASFKPRSKYQDHAILYLTDLDCAQSRTVLSYALSKELFQFTYRWLILVTSPQLQQSKISLLENGPVLVDSDVVLAERIGNMPGPNGTMISTPRGYYNGSLVDVRPYRELYRRRRDMRGHPITMSNVIQDSNTTRVHLPREDRLELQYDSITKACWSAAKIGFEMINATPRYIFSYRYGYKVNGQWSGMIADLYANKADPPLAYVANVFYLPFSTRVWVTIAVCTAIATITLFLASKVEMVMTKSTTQQQLDGGICDALLLTMSAVTQQGCYLEPRRAPGRMMVFVLFTALMALYAAYSANIVVLLQAPSDSIRSLPQLANAKITLAANDVDYNHFVFNQSREPLYTSIRDRVFPVNGKAKLYSLADGVEKIRQGLFALHSVAEPVYRQIEATFLESEKCDIATVDYLVTFDSFTPVRKGSPYLELIRVVHKQIRESGIQSAIRRRYLVSKPHCTTKMSSFSSVGLLDMRPVLILMLYGVAVSVIIVIGEIIAHKLINRYYKQEI